MFPGSPAIGGRSHLLAVSYAAGGVSRCIGRYLYHFAASAPIDPAGDAAALGQTIAHTTDGGDPFYAVDPSRSSSPSGGRRPAWPRTLDTYPGLHPLGQREVAAQTGFTGLMLKFSTSLPDRAEFEQ